MGVKVCSVFACDNDNRKLDKIIKRGNVDVVMWHAFPGLKRKAKVRDAWIPAVSKGRKDFVPKDTSTYHVCSNHFEDGKTTEENPITILFMTLTVVQAATPAKKVKRACVLFGGTKCPRDVISG